jgi:hypothetical protein
MTVYVFTRTNLAIKKHTPPNQLNFIVKSIAFNQSAKICFGGRWTDRFKHGPTPCAECASVMTTRRGGGCHLVTALLAAIVQAGGAQTCINHPGWLDRCVLCACMHARVDTSKTRVSEVGPLVGRGIGVLWVRRARREQPTLGLGHDCIATFTSFMRPSSSYCGGSIRPRPTQARHCWFQWPLIIVDHITCMCASEVYLSRPR